jgi:hypothetical protein
MQDDPRRTTIRAIRAADFGLVMTNHGGTTAICVSCGREIGEDEFGGFIKTRDRPLVFCDRAECLEYVMAGGRG